MLILHACMHACTQYTCQCIPLQKQRPHERAGRIAAVTGQGMGLGRPLPCDSMWPHRQTGMRACACVHGRTRMHAFAWLAPSSKNGWLADAMVHRMEGGRAPCSLPACLTGGRHSAVHV